MEIFLLLGANLGDRVATLNRAVALIAERVGRIEQKSSLYETAPWGVVDQPTYLNQVLAVATDHAPQRVLDVAQVIEQELGRVRLEKWGSRVIDIDILYYGHQILQTETLTVPHPYLHLRRFTLVPLAEISPAYVHPVLRETTLKLLEKCPDTSEVTIFNS
ncbi:2-amino-4-hydroxy-6-hydroxymethyldihydropteridine diphosphokinase [Spirosoma agri]|uniref:2-amino-4-hydroxy-6-hydroxymethyldihydropteridine pyrophosphokinase n=1 Tax=Spirosoma agri TaxID=1987381 RepID=A0A6M0IKY4_9BACT|nr:2-amino-4-hydroxy-6-hydroxymethyldihydropteridine diphosphokinase [Spirosoma agri]NEU68814.1 2-amino-4-hydroxy-6-hydroxymethyldihydropteridine diphosphokinase [Spirosoma agri]